MIIVYPLLVSENVNKDVIPGICKSIEKYILVHNTDTLIRHINSNAKRFGRAALGVAASIGVGLGTMYLAKQLDNGKALKLVNKALRIGEQSSLDFEDEFIFTEQRMSPEKQAYLAAKGREAAKRKAERDEKRDLKSVATSAATSAVIKHKVGATDIIIPRNDNIINLEPTWLQVGTDTGVKLLGVKVVPYFIKADASISLLMNDANLKVVNAFFIKQWRLIQSLLANAWRNIKKSIPGIITNTSVTGNPKRDIILGATGYKKNMFLCLSQTDLDQIDFNTHPGIISKLQQLGWVSMIFADDVNKRVNFCMKEMGGVCSLIPYNHMFASFGREHSTVYKDIEAAQKSVGPFFRNKGTTIRKMILKNNINYERRL